MFIYTYIHSRVIMIPIYIKFHEILVIDYLAAANVIDFKSIEGLYLMHSWSKSGESWRALARYCNLYSGFQFRNKEVISEFIESFRRGCVCTCKYIEAYGRGEIINGILKQDYIVLDKIDVFYIYMYLWS